MSSPAETLELGLKYVWRLSWLEVRDGLGGSVTFQVQGTVCLRAGARGSNVQLRYQKKARGTRANKGENCAG